MRSTRAICSLAGVIVLVTAGVICWSGQATVSAQVPNPWTVEFLPRNAEAVTLIINGKAWNPHRSDCGATWERREGRVQWVLPAEFARAERLRIVAVSSPFGTEAEVVIRHSGRERHKMVFLRTDESEVVR